MNYFSSHLKKSPSNTLKTTEKPPKLSLSGSRLSKSMLNLKSPTLKVKPTIRVKLNHFKKPLPKIENNKRERISLMQKLKKLGTTKSFKLLQDAVKDQEKLVRKSSTAETLKRIWDNPEKCSLPVQENPLFCYVESTFKLTRPSSSYGIFQFMISSMR